MTDTETKGKKTIMNQATINNEIRIALPAEFHQMDPEEKKRPLDSPSVTRERKGNF